MPDNKITPEDLSRLPDKLTEQRMENAIDQAKSALDRAVTSKDLSELGDKNDYGSRMKTALAQVEADNLLRKAGGAISGGTQALLDGNLSAIIPEAVKGFQKSTGLDELRNLNNSDNQPSHRPQPSGRGR